jgi:ribosome-binding factor A
MIRSSNYISKCLESILNDRQQSEIYLVISANILQDGYININKVVCSPTMSVVTVLFDVLFLNQLADSFEKDKQKLEEVRRKLVHAAPYFRGKLTQEAGLKYAPELRFIPFKLGGSPLQVIVAYI